MADDEGKVTVLRPEFHAFWNAGLQGGNYLQESAIVCFLDLDEGEMTLTRVFYCTADQGDERAEDVMIDWFYEDLLIQKADSVDVKVYLNYSPLKLTVDGLVAVLKNLRDMGKEVKVTMKFVELYMAAEGDEDAEENRQGLRELVDAGVSVDVMKGRDWLFLMQTLTKKAGKKRQASTNASVRARLRAILKDPHDAQTDTEVLGAAAGQV